MTIEERIERLERTNRRYRLMFTLLGVLAICTVGISATQDDGVPDVIRAKVFEVVDDEGNGLVTIGGVLDTAASATHRQPGQTQEGQRRRGWNELARADDISGVGRLEECSDGGGEIQNPVIAAQRCQRYRA